MRFNVFFTLIILMLSGRLCAAADITLLTENTPPVNYLDEDQKPAGLSVELVREMAKRVGDPGRIEVVPWARGYKDVREKPNTALFSTSRNLERESLFKWVGPLLIKKVVLYKKKGADLTIMTKDDAKKAGRIGSYKDDSKEQYLKKNGFTNLDSSLEDTANPKKLVAGRIDLWVSTSIQAVATCKLASVDPAEIEPTLTLLRQRMYLAFSKSTDDTVVAKWQRAFDEMLKDGTVARVRAKYGIDTPIVTVYTEEAPPHNYAENGEITGSATEVVREILRRAGSPDTIQLATWVRGYKELLERPNIALYCTTRNVMREKLFQWVGPVGRKKTVFFAKKSSSIKIANLEAAKKVKSIGVYKNDAMEQFLKMKGFNNLDSVIDNGANPKKLLHGRIDLWASGEDEGVIVARKAGVDPEEIEAIFTASENNVYLAVSRETDPAIVVEWKRALGSMRKDGSLKAILKKWGITWEPPASLPNVVSE